MLFNLDLHPGYDNIFAALVGHAGTSGCTFITGIDRVWNVCSTAGLCIRAH